MERPAVLVCDIGVKVSFLRRPYIGSRRKARRTLGQREVLANLHLAAALIGELRELQFTARLHRHIISRQTVGKIECPAVAGNDRRKSVRRYVGCQERAVRKLR